MPSNPNKRFKTWHFTSVLFATEEISRVFNWYAHESQLTDKVNGPIAGVKRWVEKLALIPENQPASLSFLCASPAQMLLPGCQTQQLASSF